LVKKETLHSNPHIENTEPALTLFTIQEIQFIFKKLIENKIKPKNQMESNQKLLELSQRGDVKEVKELIRGQLDLNLNVQGNYGFTPLHYACFYGHLQLVQLLLSDPRTDINSENDKGETPFAIACEKERIEIVKELIKYKKLDVNKKSKIGWTALMNICYNGRIDILKWVLACGKEVDLEVKNDDGETAISLAIDLERERRRTEFVKLLEAFRQDPEQIRVQLRRQLGFENFLIEIDS